MDKVSSKNKTILATSLLSFAGIVGLFYSKADINHTLPLIIFYFIITLNTYFSLKLFTSLVLRQNVIQHSIDFLLIILYLILAFSFDFPLRFTFIVTLLFIFAALKYVLLLGVLDHPVLLKRKIIIDIMGILMGVVAFGSVSMGYSVIGSWFISILFFFANIYLLLIKPMYRI